MVPKRGLKMKLKKRLTMNVNASLISEDKRKKRRLFRQHAKQDGIFIETREMALTAARFWRR